MATDSNDLLLDVLARFFSLRADKVTYTERVEMLSIYRYVVSTYEVRSINEVLDTLRALNREVAARSKRKRLYRLFLLTQTQSLIASGFDTTTLKPPIPIPYHENYY